MNWNNYYMEQAGGSAEFSSVYRGAPWQRGYGLGGYFKRFLTWVIPMIKDAAIATAKSGAKTVGREALSGVANFAADIAEGKDFKTAAKENASKTLNNLKEKAEQVFKGKGIKRRKKMKNLIILKKKSYKKQKFDDIFNDAI